MKIKRLLLSVFIFSFSLGIYSQEFKMCAYRAYLSEKDISDACGFNSYSSNQNAENVVDEILKNVGLYRNFIIKECPGISNAVAATVLSSLGNLERYIIYDKDFLDRVSGITGTDWSAISIMAHEIGHHLNGHNLIAGINNHDAELQADEFSGFILAKMGASLPESLSAINEFGSDVSSISHPNKTKRKQAIERGWKNGSNSSKTIEASATIELYSYNEDLRAQYINKAIKEQNNNNYDKAAEYLITAFKYGAGSKKYDLYYAIGNYINGKDYNKAIDYSLILLKNGVEELKDDDKASFYRNVALMYVEKGRTNDALRFMSIARLENPNDLYLMRADADMSYKMGDIKRYNEIMNQIANSNPKDPELYFNLGVGSAEIGEKEKAVSYYEKSLKLNPNYEAALINLVVLKLSKEDAIVEKMNSLGNSSADNRKYDELKRERINIYTETIPYLERALKINPNNKEVVRTLMNIYSQLKDDRNYNKMKKKLDRL